MRTHHRLIGLGLLIALLTACGDDSRREADAGPLDAGGHGDAAGDHSSALGDLSSGDPLPQAKFASALAQVTCLQLMACCKHEGVALSAASCDLNVGAGLALRVAGLKDNAVSYDADAAGRCLMEALAAADSGECSSELAGGSIGCEAAFIGMKKPGESCAADAECAVEQAGDEVSCDALSSGKTACVTLRRASAGDACFETCAQTAGGATCTRIVATAAGSKPLSVRGRCFFEDGLHCSTAGATPLCAKVRKQGGECAYDEECGAENLCDLETRICAPRAAGSPSAASEATALAEFCDYAAGTAQ